METSREPMPPLDYAADGWANTGKIRIRTGWFGFAVVEELYVRRDGPAYWRRLFLPRIIEPGTSHGLHIR
jgi:hypothetical protein